MRIVGGAGRGTGSSRDGKCGESQGAMTKNRSPSISTVAVSAASVIRRAAHDSNKHVSREPCPKQVTYYIQIVLNTIT